MAARFIWYFKFELRCNNNNSHALSSKLSRRPSPPGAYLRCPSVRGLDEIKLGYEKIAVIPYICEDLIYRGVGILNLGSMITIRSIFFVVIIKKMRSLIFVIIGCSADSIVIASQTPNITTQSSLWADHLSQALGSRWCKNSIFGKHAAIYTGSVQCSTSCTRVSSPFIDPTTFLESHPWFLY